MKRAILFIGPFLMLFAVGAKADSLQVGPTWNITANGEFGGSGAPPTESFILNWTLTFEEPSGGGFIMPVWNGTTSFTGVLGTFTDTVTNQFTNAADGGFVAMDDPQGDEIDFNVSDYIVVTLAQAEMPPSVFVPYLYSCTIAAICASYGTRVGFGLFSGQGMITETVTQAPGAVAEPGTLLLLLSVVPIAVLRRLNSSQPPTKPSSKPRWC